MSTMTAYEINGLVAEHDEEGYLKDIGQWTPELADLIAKSEQIEMTDDHWEVVNFLREYYEEYQIAPAVRILVKEMTKKFGKEKGDALLLNELEAKAPKDKIQNYRRIAYQIPEEGLTVCGRSYEDAFIIANPKLFPIPEGEHAGGRTRSVQNPALSSNGP